MTLIMILCTMFYNMLKDKLSLPAKTIGILIFLINTCSYTYTALINPGIPLLENSSLAKVKGANILLCKECKNWVRLSFNTSHCYECNVCVEGYDHHCPWISKCIGRKNIVSFYIFVLSTLCLFCYLVFTVSLLSNTM